MPESKKAWMEVQVNYACDTGDGGFLFYEATVYDQLGVPSYDHKCSNPDDREIYRFSVKYPRTDFVDVSNQIQF